MSEEDSIDIVNELPRLIKLEHGFSNEIITPDQFNDLTTIELRMDMDDIVDRKEEDVEVEVEVDTFKVASAVKRILVEKNINKTAFAVQVVKGKNITQTLDILLESPSPWSGLSATEKRQFWNMRKWLSLQKRLGSSKILEKSALDGWQLNEKPLPPLKRKFDIDEVTSFDPVHLSDLILRAMEIYGIREDEFAEIILGSDLSTFKDLIRSSKPWKKLSRNQRNQFQTMADWLHRNGEGRLEPFNKIRKSAGLPLLPELRFSKKKKNKEKKEKKTKKKKVINSFSSSDSEDEEDEDEEEDEEEEDRKLVDRRY